MQTRINYLAGISVLAAAAIAISAVGQQKKPGKPVVTKTTTTTTTKKVTTTTAKKKHVVAHRRKRSHHRYVKHVVKKKAVASGNGAETGLVGIHLFDPGAKVIAMYGNPDQILNLGQSPSNNPGPAGGGNFGGQGFGGQGGFAPRGGGGGRVPPGMPGIGNGPGGRLGAPGRGGPGRMPGAGAAPPVGGAKSDDSGLENDATLQVQGGGGQRAPGFGAFGGGRAPGGPPPGVPGGPGGFGGQGPDTQIGTEPAPTPYYVQWVYKHGSSQYTFIIDKEDRVVQIEAVGMGDPKVHTNRGVTFGATFKELINKYGTPDGYEITGDSFVVRYLSKYHVAFRMNRLETDKPQEMTALVVAGGKG